MFKSFIAAFFLILFSSVAFANGTIVKSSPHSVAETLDRFEKIIKSKGITVFARINHAAGAKKVGASLNPTEVIIFGNPKLGTPLLQSNQTIGIDLPLKVLVWRDSNGKVWLAYNRPTYLSTRHSISNRDKVFAKMTGVLDKLTDAALKP